MDEDSQKGKVFSDGSLGCLFTKASCFLFFDQECCYIMAMLAMELISFISDLTQVSYCKEQRSNKVIISWRTCGDITWFEGWIGQIKWKYLEELVGTSSIWRLKWSNKVNIFLEELLVNHQFEGWSLSNKVSITWRTCGVIADLKAEVVK